MSKKISGICLIFFMTCISINILLAKEEPELIAPGGAEMDFVKNITKCFGTGKKPVEARWQNLLMKAGCLEYHRSKNIITGQEVELIESKPVVRIFYCGEILAELDRDFLTGKKDVKIKYDERANLFGNFMEWDRKNDFIKISGQIQITFDEWRITGDRVEGRLNKGLVTVFGPVKGTGNTASFQAGKIIFDRGQEKFFLEDNPVLRQGKNEFSAVEIVYDLKAKKAFFNNQSEYKVVD